MTTLELVHLIIDGVSSAAAVWAVSVASSGLSTWRAQLGGTAEHDVARKVLSEIYRLEQHIRATRNMFSSTAEAADRPRDPDETPGQRQTRDTRYAYGARLRRVLDARDALRLAEIDALSLWGREASAVIRPFYDLTNTLGNTQSAFFADMEGDAPRRNIPDPALPWARGVVWEGMSNPDKFGIDLGLAVSEAETFLRDYMASGGAKIVRPVSLGMSR